MPIIRRAGIETTHTGRLQRCLDARHTTGRYRNYCFQIIRDFHYDARQTTGEYRNGMIFHDLSTHELTTRESTNFYIPVI